MSGKYHTQWKKGQPRASHVIEKLHVDSPAVDMPCQKCGNPLGDGRPLQLYALGPDDLDSVVRHERGRWYSALALLLHVECVPDGAGGDETMAH